MKPLSFKKSLFITVATLSLLIITATVALAADILYPELGTVEPEMKFVTCSGTCNYGTAGNGFLNIQNGSTASIQFGGTALYTRWEAHDVDGGSGHAPSAHAYIDGVYIKDCGNNGGPSSCDFTGLSAGFHTLTIAVNGGDPWQNVWMDWIRSSGQWDIIPPPVPGMATDISGSIHDTWQNTVTSPSFTWAKPGDAVTYLVYFGTSSTGTSNTQISTEAYIPAGPLADGIYYLRLASQDSIGNTSDWGMSYVFRVDTVAPNDTPNAIGTNGAMNVTWQNSPDTPAFSWPTPTDSLSGYAGIRLYWGHNPAGTNTDAYADMSTYTVPSSLTSGTYYLRGQVIDRAGNQNAWRSMFIYQFDNTEPVWAANATEKTGVQIEMCQATTKRPTFDWNTPLNEAPITSYLIYWGPDSMGTSSDVITDNTYLVPGDVPDGEHYFLRLSSVDEAGNTDNWRTMFDFCYEEPKFTLLLYPTVIPTATPLPTPTSIPEPVTVYDPVQTSYDPVIPTTIPTLVPSIPPHTPTSEDPSAEDNNWALYVIALMTLGSGMTFVTIGDPIKNNLTDMLKIAEKFEDLENGKISNE